MEKNEVQNLLSLLEEIRLKLDQINQNLISIKLHTGNVSRRTW